MAAAGAPGVGDEAAAGDRPQGAGARAQVARAGAIRQAWSPL